jgi:hypothetical protein
MFLALRLEGGEHESIELASVYVSAVQSICAVLIVIRYE